MYSIWNFIKIKISLHDSLHIFLKWITPLYSGKCNNSYNSNACTIFTKLLKKSENKNECE